MDTRFQLMFGPDVCGHHSETKLIVKDFELPWTIEAPRDQLTHIYTLGLYSNETFEIWIDLESEASGRLSDLLPEKEIEDPDDHKPSEWDDREWIVDQEATKSLDWDERAMIPDPSATKPVEWDDEMDGSWQPPLIQNPDYQGQWQPTLMKNPKFHGHWRPAKIVNPLHRDPQELLQHDIQYVGFELWQVKAGTLFDNILVADSLEDAFSVGREILSKRPEEIIAKRAVELIEFHDDL
ncbi:Calreticulin family [Gorgonomyces haynaldii]|nr:Calreticulin family [Gorgonomyces haynaldii]